MVRGVDIARLKRLARSALLDVGILLLAGLLPLRWFRGSLIAGMDLPWPLASPRYLMETAVSTWNPALCLGSADVSFRSGLYFLSTLVLHGLGFSELAAEKLWFVFWFAGAGLSMYALIRVLVPGKRLAALGGALFYMFNPYVMVVRWYELNLWLFFYALAPLVLALFAVSIETGRKAHMAAFLLASLLITMSHANLGSVAMLALLLGGYLVVYLVQNRRLAHKVKKGLRTALILAVLWLGISAWWILPSVASTHQEASFRQKNESTMELLELTSRESTWDRVLRLEGYWAFDRETGGDPFFTYADEYKRSHVNLLGWFIPVLGLAGLWHIRRRRLLLWPALLWIGGAFFMKGVQPPLGGLTRWLYSSLPGMAIFRHPFDKFGMLALVGLAPLVGAGMEGLYRFMSARAAGRKAGTVLGIAACTALAAILFVVLVWPMWTGEVIYAGGGDLPSLRVKEVPGCYREVASWLAGEGDGFRILPLPYNRSFWSLALFDWYQGHDPTRLVLENDTLVPSTGFRGGELAEQAAYGVLLGSECGRRLCNLLGVKYVLLREDAAWELLSGDINASQRSSTDECLYARLPEMRRSLQGQEWLQPVKACGPLTLYRNTDWRPVRVVVGARHSILDPEAENLLTAGGGEDRWEPIGAVELEEDGQGGFALRPGAGESQGPVGARRRIVPGEAPLSYSFLVRAGRGTEAEMFLQWRDPDGEPLSRYLIQLDASCTTDWAEHSGFLLKPPEAAGAELVVLMEPKEGARLEVKDLFVGEQSWIRALCSGEGYSPDTVYVSGQEAERLSLPREPSGETASPQCTLESYRPWSAKLKLETDGPCFLVLNQAFDAGWEAYLGSPGWLKVLTSSGELSASHLTANGYANAWFIEEAGEYEITLYYRPQALLYLGVVISALTWLLFAAWCVAVALRGRFGLRGPDLEERSGTAEDSGNGEV